jgi:uncharacterized RDD family membrane protein YckC
VLRVLDLLIPLLLVLPLISTWRQRLGDMIARTIVAGPAPSEDEADEGDEEDEH